MATWQRTHTCGDLRASHVGQSVTLNGWVLVARTFGNQIFVDLRDRYGLTQVVFEADDAALFQQVEAVKKEFCIAVTGAVRPRIAGKERLDIATGAVELHATHLEILNTCPTLPFEVSEFSSELANEELRLTHRYLDLRRRSLQDTLVMRHRICQVIRSFLDTEQFLEVETPLLGKSTPEGARDYLVPSRVYAGEFFALPQSPQLYKQLLMVSGFDRYFQIAKCLRDEDLRADRQPEFTQLDVEMSFTTRDDILSLVERLMAAIIHKVHGVSVPTPFPRHSYSDVMLKYGSDKPDLRFDMPITDITELARESEFGVFQQAVTAGGVVRALVVKNAADQYSNAQLKPGGEVSKLAETYKAKGVAFIKVEAEKFSGPVEKFFPAALQSKMRDVLSLEANDLILMVADKESVVCDALGALRTSIATQRNLVRNWWDEKAEHEAREAKAARQEKRAPKPFEMRADHFNLSWVVDFPMFAFDPDEGRHVAIHHPFTAPNPDDLPRLESHPGEVKAQAYDLVLNGYEAGGGSIRIHQSAVQSRVFSLLGMDEADAKSRFGFLLDALQSGAPPHGGIALGLDRLCMILGGTTNIRDVIAFPKNKQARDLMTGAPAVVEARQLKDLHIKLS